MGFWVDPTGFWVDPAGSVYSHPFLCTQPICVLEIFSAILLLGIRVRMKMAEFNLVAI